MDLAPFGGLDDLPDVHLDRLPLQPHLARCDKQAATGAGKDFAQLPDYLAQHGAGLHLPGLAPEQADQSLSRLDKGLAKRDVAENRPQFQAFDPHFVAAGPQRDRTEQRESQHGGELRCAW